MYIKSALVSTLAFAASAFAAQTSFTNPVGGTQVYAAGSQQTFTWMTACVPPNGLTAVDPKKVAVQLLNATVNTNAYFLDHITTVDCSTANQGNVPWTVPNNLPTYDGLFSLQMVFKENNAYSGSFKIIPPGGVAPGPGPTPNDPNPAPSGAGNIAPLAFAGTAAAVIASAMLL
ncbi:hypothetical protein BGX27_009125 [Mortierella sp. AM989]|nr:hypothetical protein BGX27_009125 [Mortierella sp. AM989]